MALATGPASNEAQTEHQPGGHLGRLEDLATELGRYGLVSRMMAPHGRIPGLHVVNPAVSRMAEDVYLGRAKDGMCWFWWSWAEQIARGDEFAKAAALIARVLSAGDTGR